MAWEIVGNSKTAVFKDVVGKVLGSGSGRVHLVTANEAEGEKIFDELAMQVVRKEGEYYLVVLKSRYDRLEYEKFLQMCKEKAVPVGSSMWTAMQLTFPMEFWSLTKQQSIMNKIAKQQFMFLATVLKCCI